MIDRAMLPGIVVGTGPRTAAYIETILDNAETNAAAIVRRIARPGLNEPWRTFLIDAITAAQLAAAAVDLDHDHDVGPVAAPLVRQLAEAAAMTAADDTRALVVGDSPSTIW